MLLAVAVLELLAALAPGRCVLLARDTEGLTLPASLVSCPCLAVRLAKPSLLQLHTLFVKLMGHVLLLMGCGICKAL